MAHFAKIDSNNIVTEVVVLKNEILLKADNTESEYKGKTFLNSLFGSATWVQTSYNGSIRKQFAGIGFTYDEINDVFIEPKPFESWTLDTNFDWQPPVPHPIGDNIYFWDEETLSWVRPNSPFPSWTWNETEWEWQPPVDYPLDYETTPYRWNEENQTWDLI